MDHSNEHESHIEMSFHQDKYDAVKSSSVSEAGIINATKKNLERMMLLVSFWNKISVISCMIAVSMDPLFLYTAYLDYNNGEVVCLGTDKRLWNTVLITRSLTDFTFLFHIIHQLREAMKAVIPVSSTKRKLVQSGNSKLFNWFGNAKAIAKKLSWSSFLADILAILPIPHVLLALFYAPNYEFTEKKMTLNYILLAQYVPRMYRIFSSSKQLLRKSSSMWVKAAFYFFMYILSSHVIGAFWYFSTVQIELVCWKRALKRALNGTAPIFRCDDTSKSPDPLSNFVYAFCKNDVQFDYGSFLETVTDGKTGSKGFRDKLAYFIWWGLKNLSNFGTDIDPSKFIWENGFAILVSVIGLVLFAFLIGNMQHCMQSSEEKKVATDKVQMKEQELKEWMDNNGLPEKLGKDAEKLKIEMMKKITENLKDDNDAEVQNLFPLLPWNTVKDLKLAICMSLLKKVRTLKDMDERGLRLICHYLKPVTYTENTFAFRMGEPLDRMLFVMEGIMLIYPTSTTTATATATVTDGEVGGADIGGSPTTIRCSLENGDVYGDGQLLSWASPPDMSNISYAHLPILTENVKCLSEVEGFVLTAKDLKSVVSLYNLRGNINSSVQLVVEVEHSTTSIARGPSTVRRNRIHPI